MAGTTEGSQSSPTSQSFDDPGHYLYLSTSDHPGVTLVSQPLTETTYNTWHQSMLIALSTKNKLGFIDGTISKPSDSSAAELLQWTCCNNMVKAWLLNSISKEISASVIYCNTARDIWVELKERFSQVNGPRMFQLEQGIHTLVQGPYQQYQRTMKFLMGLNDSYAAIRGKILLMDPLPSINHIYGLILQEECQRNIHVSPSIDTVALAAKGFLPSSTSRVPPRKKHLKCTHCHKDGHTIDRCYLIHGFPHGSRNTGSNHKASVHHVSSATNKSTTSSLPFTLDQCQQLLALLNNANPSSSMANHVVEQLTIWFALQLI
ncbi:hypothetical protein F0562_005750 [Nyssa sinensis]|uniref:Retrotransposon Copia-like N-terminal domain-containing protein n=1 Tax=Nyssa sinensis TaxID=561372 RepID=A0A5J5APN5_9ASTE|nr:hypothetical protein F0562_005750 [Nyssa sinensis]